MRTRQLIESVLIRAGATHIRFHESSVYFSVANSTYRVFVPFRRTGYEVTTRHFMNVAWFRAFRLIDARLRLGEAVGASLKETFSAFALGFETGRGTYNPQQSEATVPCPDGTHKPAVVHRTGGMDANYKNTCGKCGRMIHRSTVFDPWIIDAEREATS